MQQQTLAKLLADKERRSDTELKMKEEMEKLAEEKKSREKEERDIMQVEREREGGRGRTGGGERGAVVAVLGGVVHVSHVALEGPYARPACLHAQSARKACTRTNSQRVHTRMHTHINPPPTPPHTPTYTHTHPHIRTLTHTNARTRVRTRTMMRRKSNGSRPRRCSKTRPLLTSNPRLIR